MSSPDPGVPSPGERPPRWYVAANAALDAWEIGHRRSAMYAAMGELREACREFAARASRGDNPAGEPDTETVILSVLLRMERASDPDSAFARCAKSPIAKELARYVRAALPSGDATTDALRDMVKRLLMLIDEAKPGAFKNGNTDITGSIDEGEILTGRLYREAEELLASRAPRRADGGGVSLCVCSPDGMHHSSDNWWCDWCSEETMTDATGRYERLAADFYRETGMMAPGKDVSAAMGGPTYDERWAAWEPWLAKRLRAGAPAAPREDRNDG